MKNEKKYNIYYGNDKNEYITRYLPDTSMINGYLTEAAAFDLFFDNMIMCNDYLKYRYDNIEPLIDAYDEKSDEYIDEYQFFIVDPMFEEDITINAIKKMGNTLYYDNDLNLYIMGVTDLGTSRTIVFTDIKTEVE